MRCFPSKSPVMPAMICHRRGDRVFAGRPEGPRPLADAVEPAAFGGKRLYRQRDWPSVDCGPSGPPDRSSASASDSTTSASGCGRPRSAIPRTASSASTPFRPSRSPPRRSNRPPTPSVTPRTTTAVGPSLDGQPSDAYATGSALVALHQAGGLANRRPRLPARAARPAPVPARRWLLAGRLRGKPFQPYFKAASPTAKTSSSPWPPAAGPPPPSSWPSLGLSVRPDRTRQGRGTRPSLGFRSAKDDKPMHITHPCCDSSSH